MVKLLSGDLMNYRGISWGEKRRLSVQRPISGDDRMTGLLYQKAITS